MTKRKGAAKGILKDVKANKYSDEESLLSEIDSDDVGSRKLFSTDAPWEHTVPQSRFRRELNKWMRLIEKYNHTVAITRNNKIICYAVPHCEENWDKQIEYDIATGKLDAFAESALADSHESILLERKEKIKNGEAEFISIADLKAKHR